MLLPDRLSGLGFSASNDVHPRVTCGKMPTARASAPAIIPAGSPGLAICVRLERGEPMRRVHVVVRGRVQGVGFRDACEAAARQWKLAGWVRNLPDRVRVELEVEGPDEAVQRFLDWVAVGPPAARVESVDVAERPVRGEETPFRVLR
jgi:acylphosphatase